jgi:hypothetical protein
MQGCSDSKGPNVDKVELSVPIERFDQYFFTSVDTTDIAGSIRKLEAKYPYFTNDFITKILRLPLVPGKPDSIPSVTASELARFLQLTRPLFDSVAPRFKNTTAIQSRIENGLKHVKYYYPSYKIPKVLMYLGPFNAPGVALTNEAIAIGLQLYAGKDFSFYTSQTGLEMFPSYISRTFEPEFIPANCLRVVAEDIYPETGAGKPLIEQMIEKGKQWYLLNQLIPEEADSVKTGFTAKQLEFCQANEGMIWNAIMASADLYTTEPALIQTYLGTAPTTEGMPAASPGNIGQWIGYRIVQQFAQKNGADSPVEILKTPASQILSEAKYKPR